MWLICRIINSKTGKQLGSEQFHESNEDLTLGALFNTLELPNTGSLTVKGVSLSESGKPSDVWLVSQFNKPYVKFTVDVVTPTTSHSENAFDRLMAGSRRLFQMERQNRMPQLPAMKNSWVYTERYFAKPHHQRPSREKWSPIQRQAPG